MDLETFLKFFLHDIITAFKPIFDFLDLPKLKLTWKKFFVILFWFALLCGIYRLLPKGDVLLKILYVCFSAGSTYYVGEISEILKKHENGCKILLVLGFVALTIVWSNLNILPSSESIQTGEKKQPVDASLSASQANRMRSAEHLSIQDESNWENKTFWHQDNIQRNAITKVKFCNKLSDIDIIRHQLGSFSWDVSAKADHTVIACFYDGTLWVAADGKIELSEDLSFLFAGFSNLTVVDFNQSVDSSYTTNMSNMFALCKSLNNLDLMDLNTENVTDMFRMFYCCESMTDLNLVGIDTSQVTNMGNMFSYCSSFSTIDVHYFSTKNVKDMGNMFYCCEKLESVDVSHFDTSNVELLTAMFYGCTNLKSINVSNFNFSNIKGMCNAFYNSGIHEIKVSDWPSLDKSDYVNFMPLGSTVNGIKWDEYSGEDLIEK